VSRPPTTAAPTTSPAAVEATTGLQREALRSALGAAAAVPQPTFDVYLDEAAGCAG
jgi:hypothetical protein